MKSNLFPILLYATVMTLSAMQEGKGQDYRKYNKQTIEAEKLISEEKFLQALATYDQLFQNYDFIFLRDFKIAAQLSLYLTKKDKCLDLIKRGINAGWELKNIKKNDYLKNHLKKTDWKIIKQSYPGLHSTYLAGLEYTLREKVQRMFKEDQKKALGALVKVGNKAQEKYAVNKFAPHSEIQISKLIEILEEYGYPGEMLIGNNFWMSTILSHHNSISKDYNSYDTAFNFIKPKLIHAIDLGRMSPYEYALIDDWQKAVSSGGTVAGYGFLTSVHQSTLVETDQLRRLIGLRSIELRNKLVDIEMKTGMDFYLPGWIEGKINVN
ncbi:hypothetical protein [Algoriphagus resistens]|uniref:hypothetical protein n=1 Tax=Algoriphagus resistens TaxID=1750590 RepID=UPI0007168F02|nr:hypothetical protein [Algoriphagus resistens]